MRYTDPTGQAVPVAVAACMANPLCAAAAVAAAAATVKACVDTATAVRNWYSQEKTPTTGEPGSTYVNPSGQERKYGSDGKPEYDIDWHTDHGAGTPHGHNWDRGPNGEPVRGPGVPLSPWPQGRGRGQQ